MPAEESAATEVGVVDRLTGAVAVVLVGDDEAEHHLDVTRLPQGAKEGSWLRVRRGNDGLVVVGLDAEGSADQRQAMRHRLERLRREHRGGRFG